MYLLEFLETGLEKDYGQTYTNVLKIEYIHSEWFLSSRFILDSSLISHPVHFLILKEST